MSLNSLLDRKLILERPTLSADSSGGTIRSFSAVLSDIPCAIAPSKASVTTDYARRDMVVDFHVFTTLDLDTLVSGGVKLGDRLIDGSVYYLIKAVKKSANAMIASEPLYQLDCEKK